MTAPTIGMGAGLFWGMRVNYMAPLTVQWTYSDTESSPQVAFEIGARAGGGSVWENIVTTSSTAQYYTIPALWFLPGVYQIRIRAQDSTGEWSDYITWMMDTTGWSIAEGTGTASSAQVASSAYSGIDHPYAFGDGIWEFAVRTMNSVGYGDLSTTKTFDAWPTSRYIMVGGKPKAVPVYVHNGTSFVPRNN